MKEHLRRLYNLYSENTLVCEEMVSEEEDKERLLENLDKCRDNIIDNLDDDGKALLAELEKIYSDFIVAEKEAAFIGGFSLAAKLMSESLT